MQHDCAVTNVRCVFLDLSRAEEDVTCYSRVANFLLACLTRIPTRTCQALLQQVSHVALPMNCLIKNKSYSSVVLCERMLYVEACVRFV